MGIQPSPALLDSIAAYIELLARWNRKINLTAITDPRDMISRNFVESFLARRWLSSPEGRLCDLGSGAGFPGLALKLILPDWQVTLIESNSRKCAFLSEAVRALKLRDVLVERARWQEANIPVRSFNAITCRAVGEHESLIKWARRHLALDGRLLLWIGSGDADSIALLPGWSWERLLAPGSRERVILAGKSLD